LRREYLTLALHYDFLAEILPYLEDRAIYVGYGLALPDDPHDFTPDLECCTTKEIYNWHNDKIKFNNGQQSEMSGKWGIGTYIYRDNHYIRLVERVKKFLELWDCVSVKELDLRLPEGEESISQFCFTCQGFEWCKRAVNVGKLNYVGSINKDQLIGLIVTKPKKKKEEK